MTLEICIDRVCQGEYSAFVLIVAPDNSMTLCSDEINIYLFDSHLHQNHGAWLHTVKRLAKLNLGITLAQCYKETGQQALMELT